MRAVHGAVVQVQRVRAAEFGQQNGVQARPDAGLGPVSQPAPGRHPGAAHRLGRDIAPRDTGSQHEQDSGERHTVGNTQPSGIPAASPPRSRSRWWDCRCKACAVQATNQRTATVGRMTFSSSTADEELLGLASACHPATLRQMRWTNSVIKVLAPQSLSSL